MGTLALSLDSEIDLTRLLTPAQSCVCLRLGRIEATTLRVMNEHDFEFAPVRGPEGRFIGLTRIDQAITLEKSNSDLSYSALITPLPSLPAHASMNKMLVQLAATGVAVVVKEMNDEASPQDWIGLITSSDLNKHYFRVLVYEWLAELEIGFVRMIEQYAGNFETWIRALPDEAQARILGYWQLSKMNGTDIGPLAACTLTDLTKIARSDGNTLGALQLSKTKFEAHVGGLPQLRNQVMHPVRPMVTKPADVNQIYARLQDAALLVSRIAQTVCE